jgi:hypothetical protein
VSSPLFSQKKTAKRQKNSGKTANGKLKKIYIMFFFSKNAANGKKKSGKR